MTTRGILRPDSFDQILYVVLIWVVLLFVSNIIFDRPVIRLEIVIGTGIVLVWVIWGVYYRLDQIREERFNRDR